MGQKKTVDVIGSVDDYAIEPSVQDPPQRVEEDSWVEPHIEFMLKGKVLEGKSHSLNPANPSYIVGENRWGDKMVWPMKPYCVSCSPAAKRDNDDEKSKSFDEYGAEREMSRRASRLMGLGASQYFSFTLIETNDGIICSKCGLGVENDEEPFLDNLPQGLQQDIELEVAHFDASKPMLGIRVDEGIFRFPQHLVANWVKESSFEESPLSVVRKNKIHTIKGKDFIKNAIFEEANKQWLLNPDYCTVSDFLYGQIVNEHLAVAENTLVEWRKTALPLETMVVAEEKEGVVWAVSQGLLLKDGQRLNTLYGSLWAIPLQKCKGPLVGMKDI